MSVQAHSKAITEYLIKVDDTVLKCSEDQAVKLVVDLMLALPPWEVQKAQDMFKAEVTKKNLAYRKRQEDEADTRDRRMNSPA